MPAPGPGRCTPDDPDNGVDERMLSSPPRGNLHHLLAPRYDREENRTRMTDPIHQGEKSVFVARLEEVLPLLRERSSR